MSSVANCNIFRTENASMHIDSLRHLYMYTVRKSVLRAPILEAQFWAHSIDSTQALQQFQCSSQCDVELQCLQPYDLVVSICNGYDQVSTGQPYYLRSLLHYYTPHRTLRSVNQRLLEQPWVSTEFGKRAFSHLSPKTWNSLPLELRLTSTFNTFKRYLKTYLFA